MYLHCLMEVVVPPVLKVASCGKGWVPVVTEALELLITTNPGGWG